MNPSGSPIHGPPRRAIAWVLGVTKIGTRNVGYWINAVGRGEEDYYSRPGESPGIWAGALADQLGLSGEVDHDDYMAVFAGMSGHGGAVLVERPRPRRWIDADGRKRKADPVLGYDLRFSAPKSVSLLWAIGDDDVRGVSVAAHELAVREALRYLEWTSCWVQRGKGGAEIERGRGFVGMAFLHGTSRAGDPALHTHMLISNMTRAEKDGKWLSLASPKGRMPLWLHAKAAGHIYQAVLRAEITRRLGLEWGEVENGHSDLVDIAQEVLDHFSRRRAEIVEYMAERGVRSAAAAEIAAYRTRSEKDLGVGIDTRRLEWISRAQEFDLTPRSIAELVAGSVAREPRAIDAGDLRSALGELEARHSHFGRREVLCEIANRMVEGADYDSLSRAVGGLLRSDRVVALDPEKGGSYFTTARLFEMEKRIFTSATEGVDAGAAVIDEQTLAGVLDRHGYLGAEQSEMVRRLTTGGERIAVVAARPGTGKTTALRAAAEGWAACGFRGIGVSTARSATNEITDVGLPATSITKFRILIAEREERGLPLLPPGVVIVVDEASTAGTEDLAQLQALVDRHDGKLVLMGDPRQIGSVAAGGVYANLAVRLDAIELSEIRRQRDPIDRRVVELAHEGKGSDALEVMQATGRLRMAPTHPEALGALALDWHERISDGRDAVMIARRNEDVRRLNDLARALREECGELGERIETVAGEFAVGERVMTRVNTREVSNRERWEVVGVDRRRGSIDLARVGELADGATLSTPYLERRTPTGEAALQHADAITTYASQGKTFGDKAFVLLDQGINREDFLVAVSRSRGDTVAYGVTSEVLLDDELGPGRREISDHLHDLRIGSERVAGEYAADEVKLRMDIEELGQVGLAALWASLTEEIREAEVPSPATERLAGLDRRIEAARSRLDGIATKESEAGGPAVRKTFADRRRQGQKQLRRLEDDRDGLARAVEGAPDPEVIDDRRYELRIVEERMLLLRRMKVAAERIEPTQPILEALGVRPEDPDKARAWADGVDLIHGFRLRWGVADSDPDLLGARSDDPRRQHDRATQARRLSEIQESIDREPRSHELEFDR